MMNVVPIVDFARCGLDQANVAENDMKDVGEPLYDALRMCGFAYLKNSGIHLPDVDLVNKTTAQFFEATFEEKKKYLRREDNYGYISLHLEQINPNGSMDHKEAFNINSRSLVDPDIPWPTEICPNFYTEVKTFMEKCRLLTLRILKVLGVGMKLVDSDQLVKAHALINEKTGNCTAMRTLYYPVMPGSADQNYIRLGEHCDYGSITLLFQDDVGGLQIESMEGKFVDAPPIENTVLINIGDLLQFWSGNILKSTKHRVVNTNNPEKQKRVRRSLAYFVHPDDEVFIDEELVYQGCTSKRLTTFGAARMTALGYLIKKFEQTY